MKTIVALLLIFSGGCRPSSFKKISVYKTMYHLGVPEKEQLNEESFFDDNGRKEKIISYNNDERIDMTILYTYNQKDSIVETNATGANAALIFRETRDYDPKGNRKELIYYSAEVKDNYKYRNIAEYDQQGRMICLSWYWPEGLKSVNKYRYDNNLKVEDSEFDPGGRLLYTWKYKYDPKGNLLEATQYYPGNIIGIHSVYTYNAHQLATEANYKGLQLSQRSTFEYNNNGLLISKSELSSTGKLSAKYRYVYQ